MNLLQRIFGIKEKTEEERFTDFLYSKLFINTPLYPDNNDYTYLNFYTSNSDVFTIINKITEPASTVPIYQYNEEGEEFTGKMLGLLNSPNGYFSKAEFIEAALSFYLIYGNCFIMYFAPDNGVNAGKPVKLFLLPPPYVIIHPGTQFDPILKYEFYVPSTGNRMILEKDKVFHWREFNPDFGTSGGSLRGMSRLKPLIKTACGSVEAYDALVRSLQAQGMWGLLSILDESGTGAKPLTREQKSELKSKFRADSKAGELTIINSLAQYTKLGMSPQELRIIEGLGLFRGTLCDAYNVPNQLLSGSQDRTYNNYPESKRALWQDAIMPSLNAFLEGFSRWLAPKVGEEGHYLAADYSTIPCLQVNMAEVINAMVAAQAFTKNEIRQAVGYGAIDDPLMDEVFVSMGMTPLSFGDETEEDVEAKLNELGLNHYLKK